MAKHYWKEDANNYMHGGICRHVDGGFTMYATVNGELVKWRYLYYGIGQAVRIFRRYCTKLKYKEV